jgi:hypothetical protein
MEYRKAKTPPETVDDYVKIMKGWYIWRSVWNTVHYCIGGGSAFLSVLVVAKTGKATAAGASVMDAQTAAICAGIAAVLTFLLTLTKPGDRAGGYQSAARHMEWGLAKYGKDIADLKPLHAEAVRMLPR